MSKKVIAAMKKHMSLEERKYFVEQLRVYNGYNFEESIDGKTLAYLLSQVYYHVFDQFYDRFTTKEKRLTINIKEL